ncbi:hypothetical protein [Paenirhodobacter populi]|uniref:hypothetical protein n=1 Tax=Paenirhodobacter populi TaxID=2306993 RepID=UPI0013E34422|nr:hypothetical protein [Sinirhodobacter populi]
MFSHAFNFAFEVTSQPRDSSDVTPEKQRSALIRRTSSLPRPELKDAFDCFDSAEMPDD